MKTKISPTVVGAFVIGAFALLIIALLTFGGINFFDKPERFVVYFDESIHGLDLGSPVKLRGVRVGRVTALNIRYDVRENHSVVAVLCELNRDMVTDPGGAIIDVASREELEKLVQRGLRAQLGVAGLATGLLFVELDFKDPLEYPAGPVPPNQRYVVVPSVRSAIAEFQAGLSELLAKLKEVDLAAISKEITGLAVSARKQLDAVDLKGVAEQWKKTGAQFEALANGPEIKEVFANLNLAIGDMRKTVAKLDGQIEPTSQELAATMAEAKKTLQAFNDTADAARKFLAAHNGVGGELGETLGHLNEAADSVRRLAEFLERNPSALITGRKRP